jgi:hypothetical protein
VLGQRFQSIAVEVPFDKREDENETLRNRERDRDRERQRRRARVCVCVCVCVCSTYRTCSSVRAEKTSNARTLMPLLERYLRREEENKEE